MREATSGLRSLPAAEGVDAVLEFGVGEFDVLDVDLAGKLDLLGNADVAGRDAEAGVEGDVAPHDGRLRLHAELKEILDAAVGHVDDEVDVVAFAVDVDDRPFRSEVGVGEGGGDGVEGGVAVGSVDVCVEGGF
jgi:hypothetical protein